MSLKENRAEEVRKYGWSNESGWSDQWFKVKQINKNDYVVTFSEKGLILAQDLSCRNRFHIKTLVNRAIQEKMLELKSVVGSGNR